MIKNNPTDKGQHIEDLRNAIEHRATWMYLLIKEARKRGLDYEFAHAAVHSCGEFHGCTRYPKTDDLMEFGPKFATQNVIDIFEMDVETTPEELKIEFHYCPLVSAWLKQGATEEELVELCEIAMDGDRGIASVYPKFEFALGKTIAKGDDICQVWFRKV